MEKNIVEEDDCLESSDVFLCVFDGDLAMMGQACYLIWNPFRPVQIGRRQSVPEE